MTTAEVYATGNKDTIEMHHMLVRTVAEAMAERVFGFDRKHVAVFPNPDGVLMRIGHSTIQYGEGSWLVDNRGRKYVEFSEAIEEAILRTVYDWLADYRKSFLDRQKSESVPSSKENPCHEVILCGECDGNATSIRYADSQTRNVRVMATITS